MLDMLLLCALPLREPVAAAGPIVMNSAEEVQMAYRQLQEGTFLQRSYVLKQQTEKGSWKA
jgi:redox-sensitive bicupin YhaK (pirin superfamily)